MTFRSFYSRKIILISLDEGTTLAACFIMDAKIAMKLKRSLFSVRFAQQLPLWRVTKEAMDQIFSLAVARGRKAGKKIPEGFYFIWDALLHYRIVNHGQKGVYEHFLFQRLSQQRQIVGTDFVFKKIVVIPVSVFIHWKQMEQFVPEL